MQTQILRSENLLEGPELPVRRSSGWRSRSVAGLIQMTPPANILDWKYPAMSLFKLNDSKLQPMDAVGKDLFA
jgi:hypothetical protein